MCVCISSYVPTYIPACLQYNITYSYTHHKNIIKLNRTEQAIYYAGTRYSPYASRHRGTTQQHAFVMTLNHLQTFGIEEPSLFWCFSFFALNFFILWSCFFSCRPLCQSQKVQYWTVILKSCRTFWQIESRMSKYEIPGTRSLGGVSGYVTGILNEKLIFASQQVQYFYPYNLSYLKTFKKSYFKGKILEK